MKKNYLFYIIVTFGLLAALGLSSAFLPAKEYSENENRYLEKFPSLSISGILSGEFQNAFEEAVSDQFLWRDDWMKRSTAIQKSVGYQEVNGVYFGKDGYYFEKKTQEMIDQTQYAKNLHYVEYLGTKKEGKVNLILVPSAATILSDKLPKKAPYYDAGAMYRTAETLLSSVQTINIRPALKEQQSKEQLYFKTDHHWTLFGAYTGYQAFCDAIGLKTKAYEYFEPKKVSSDFYGTLYSKVLDDKAKPDVLYAAQNIPEVTVESDGRQSQGVYDVQKAIQKDKYAYFFGGNHGEVVIKQDKKNTTSKKKLLMFKDSYANSLVPFLLEDYSEIVMIDLRYYRASVQAMLRDKEYDDVLVLYEMSNFAQETNLYKLVH